MWGPWKPLLSCIVLSFAGVSDAVRRNRLHTKAEELVSLEDSPGRFINSGDIQQTNDFVESESHPDSVLELPKFLDGLVSKLKKAGNSTRKAVGLTLSVVKNIGFGIVFPFFNFVSGFKADEDNRRLLSKIRDWFWAPKRWKAPKKGEKIGVMTFNEMAEKRFGRRFPQEFFDYYYTGGKIPSWEDNFKHATGVNFFKAGVAVGRTVLGRDPAELNYGLEPRLSFNTEDLVGASWNGFPWFRPYDIKYASNGFWGVKVVDDLLHRHNTKDTLGVLMTDSVFSAHLHYHEADGTFTMNLDSMGEYTPLSGYAKLGGKATFVYKDGRLQTQEITYQGKTFAPTDDDQDPANVAFKESRLIGWRYAEKAVIASLLSMTNLVLHVKDLHLELAATFQAITVDSFSEDPTNPVRRFLDPFIHRSVQATNDNFRLLFDYKAAEFSLAPLPYDEQLRLMDEAIKTAPLDLSTLDLERFGQLHGMNPAFSTKSAQTDNSVWFWRWHYRALTVQRLFEKMLLCQIDANYGPDPESMASDEAVQTWWKNMIKYLPSIRRATENHPEWANPNTLTPDTLVNVAKTLFTWLGWIHEDVGHAASAYVFNPVHTPMAVPLDGEGVPLLSWSFNVAAYRGFVFLNRAKLLGTPPDFWFSEEKGDKKCFTDLQAALRDLGKNDPAFSECDKTGFYSCVERVETCVSS